MLLLGIGGYQVLRVGPAGLNVSVFWIVSTAAFAGLLGGPSTAPGRWLALPVLVFATSFALRDAAVMQVLNFGCAAAGFGLFCACARAGHLRAISLSDLIRSWVTAPGYAAMGPLPERAVLGASLQSQRQVRWEALSRVGLGLLIALPMISVFGALFAQADATFEQLLRTLFKFDGRELFRSVFFSSLIAWGLAGMLHRTLRPPRVVAGHPQRGCLGGVEIGVAMGALCLLFSVFVMLQFRYLFSTLPIGNSPDLNEFADYARRGFGELVAVAALVLIVLLSADWIICKHDLRVLVVVRLLGLLLSVLTFVIMTSALQRMIRYSQAFGLTELRIYTTAFMLWLGLLLAWQMITVLRGRRRNFAIGGLGATFVVVMVLNVINIDAWIVSHNVSLARNPPPTVSRRYAGFDAAHAITLSDDAIPTLLEVLHELPVAEQIMIARSLTERARPSNVDWRNWNLGRWQAMRYVEANWARLSLIAEMRIQFP